MSQTKRTNPMTAHVFIESAVCGLALLGLIALAITDLRG